MTNLSFCQNDPPEYIILTKEEAGHSYTFWSMPIMIFGPVSNFGDQSLCIWKKKDPLGVERLGNWFFFCLIKDDLLSVSCMITVVHVQLCNYAMIIFRQSSIYVIQWYGLRSFK